MQATAKALPIVGILAGLSNYHGKLYCYPSQKKILELLGIRLNMFISIATLNRYLRVLEDEGYIHRTRRITFHRVKGLLFQSTMYAVLGKGLELLGKIGVAIYDKIKGLVNGLNGNSKKDAQDPERVYYIPDGKSYKTWLAEGGKRPSIKK